MATKISAPFPALELEEKSIVGVDTGNVNAKITRMVVHFTQDVPEEALVADLIVPPYVYATPT
jgi:hypothetical protein